MNRALTTGTLIGGMLVLVARILTRFLAWTRTSTLNRALSVVAQADSLLYRRLPVGWASFVLCLTSHPKTL